MINKIWQSRGLAYFLIGYSVVWVLALVSSVLYVDNFYAKRQAASIESLNWESYWREISFNGAIYLFSEYANPPLPPEPCHVFYGENGVYAFPVAEKDSLRKFVFRIMLDLARPLETTPPPKLKNKEIEF